MSICVIAECGVNHQGRLDEALWLIDRAKEAGADVAKFQLWTDKPELSHLALGREQMRACRDYCMIQGIEFMCTPFDASSLWFLADTLNVRRLKLASSAIFDHGLLAHAERTRLPVILSAGMANEHDIATALRKLRYSAGLTLLHCVSAYPTPVDQANLTAINALRSAFDLPVGYSDHTGHISAICAAAALGASVIEMHLTRDRSQPGPDHASSYTPESFALAVESARTIEAMLGDGRIAVQDCAAFLRRKFA